MRSAGCGTRIRESGKLEDGVSSAKRPMWAGSGAERLSVREQEFVHMGVRQLGDAGETIGEPRFGGRRGRRSAGLDSLYRTFQLFTESTLLRVEGFNQAKRGPWQRTIAMALCGDGLLRLPLPQRRLGP